MSAYVAGKALLVVTRDATRAYKGWDVRVIVQRLTHSSKDRWAAENWAGEEWESLEWYPERLPRCTRRMKEGDTMRIAVKFKAEAYVAWDGGGDTELTIIKARLLRHQRRSK